MIVTQWSTQKKYLVGREFFKNLNQAISNYKKIPGRNFLSVRLVGDAEMKKLNLHWKNKNQPTDVLSWSYQDQPKKLIQEIWLGEIVIDYQRAEIQAKELGHALRTEIAWLYVHGVLHILGYHHKTKNQRNKMEQLEDKILKKASY